MSANLMASSLPASHAMPNRELHVAHSDTPVPAGDFDSLLSGLDPKGAANIDIGQTRAAASRQLTATSANLVSPAPSRTKLTANVDAALSLLGTFAFPATAAASTTSTQVQDAATKPSFSSGTPLVKAGQATTKSAGVATPVGAAPVWPSISSSQNLANLDTGPVSLPSANTAADLQTAVTPEPGAALGTISYVQMNKLAFAPELGFQSLQTKTHLAVSEVTSAAIAGLQGQAQGGGAIQPAAATITGAPGVQANTQRGLSTPRETSTPSASPASAIDATSPSPLAAALVQPQAISQHTASVSRKPSTPAASPGSTDGQGAAPTLATDAVAPTAANPEHEQPPSQDSGAQTPSAEPAKTIAANASVTTAASGFLVSAPSTDANTKIVNLSDLGDEIFNQAQTLTQPNAQSSTPVASAPIKQLQLNLQPVNLGAVAVTLKLTNGKLSVEIGVANSNTLAQVEGQRDAIVLKLQTGDQPLESFVVHQQVFSAAPTPQSSSTSSQTDSFGNASGNDSSSQTAREQTPRQPRTPTPQSVAPARGSLRTDLVV